MNSADRIFRCSLFVIQYLQNNESVISMDYGSLNGDGRKTCNKSIVFSKMICSENLDPRNFESKGQSDLTMSSDTIHHYLDNSSISSSIMTSCEVAEEQSII